MCERRGELSGGSPAGRKRKLKVQLERGRAPKSHDDKLRLPQRSNGVHECGVPFVGARRRRRSGGAAAVSSRASSHMQREWMVQLVECREPLRRVRRAPSTMCAGSALRRCRRLHRCQRRASEQRSCPNERAACTRRRRQRIQPRACSLQARRPTRGATAQIPGNNNNNLADVCICGVPGCSCVAPTHLGHSSVAFAGVVAYANKMVLVALFTPPLCTWWVHLQMTHMHFGSHR